MKIIKKILINKKTGYRYIIIPSMIDADIGDFVVLNNKLKMRIRKQGCSKIATIPKKFKELKTGDFVEITDIIKVDRIDFIDFIKQLEKEKLKKAGIIPEIQTKNKEVIQYEKNN